MDMVFLSEQWLVEQCVSNSEKTTAVKVERFGRLVGVLNRLRLIPWSAERGICVNLFLCCSFIDEHRQRHSSSGIEWEDDSLTRWIDE